jgi:hypothetical protein
MKRSLLINLLQIAVAAALAIALGGCKQSDEAGKAGIGSMKTGDATESALGSSSTTPLSPSAASGALPASQ